MTTPPTANALCARLSHATTPTLTALPADGARPLATTTEGEGGVQWVAATSSATAQSPLGVQTASNIEKCPLILLDLFKEHAI